MTQKLLLSCCIAAIAGAAQADVLGFSVGAYQWQQNYDGTVRSGGANVDLRDDLGFADERNNVYFAEFDHPLPLLPNLRLQHTEISATERTTLATTISFDDVTYTAGMPVKSELDLTHTDATFYYRLLDNWIKLRVGLTARQFDQGVEIRSLSNGEASSESIDSVLPLLYLAARFDLPFSGLYAGGDVNAIAYSDSHLYDGRINIGYEMPFGLGVEAGYRRFELKYDDNGDTADITIDGAYAEVFYHF
jgi:outer membrane protein